MLSAKKSPLEFMILKLQFCALLQAGKVHDHRYVHLLFLIFTQRAEAVEFSRSHLSHYSDNHASGSSVKNEYEQYV